MGYSESGLRQILNNMKQKGYVVAKADNINSRKQIFTLSAKAYDALLLMEEYWEAYI